MWRKQKHKLSNKTLLAYLALLSATAIWGAAGPVIKLTLDYIPVFSFLFYRFLLVGIILLPFVIYELKRHPINKKDIPTLVLLSLAGQTSILLVFLGLKYTTAIDAALIGAISPIFIIAAGHYFYKDKINKNLEIGIIIATLGTLLVVVEPALSSQKMIENTALRVFGNIIIVLYNITFAIYIILSKRVMGKRSRSMSQTLKKLKINPLENSYSPFIHTSFSFYVALVSFLPFVILERLGVFGSYNFSIFDITTTPLLGLLYMVIFSSILAYLAFAWGLENARVSDSALFTYLGPIFTLPIAYILLSEIPSFAALLGASIIAVGVVVAEQHK